MKHLSILFMVAFSVNSFAASSFEQCMADQETAQLAEAKMQITCQYLEVRQSACDSSKTDASCLDLQASQDACAAQKTESKSASDTALNSCSDN